MLAVSLWSRCYSVCLLQKRIYYTVTMTCWRLELRVVIIKWRTSDSAGYIKVLLRYPSFNSVSLGVYNFSCFLVRSVDVALLVFFSMPAHINAFWNLFISFECFSIHFRVNESTEENNLFRFVHPKHLTIFKHLYWNSLTIIGLI